MTDAIDDMFSGLEQFYPGSKRKRREAIIAVTTNQTPVGSWEDLSVIKHIHGQDRPMYTIGALARALNKSEKSVRLWTTRGYIPNAPYRMKSVTGRDGVERRGRRLYTKEMIEAAVDSFARRGLLDAPRVEWSRHTDIGVELSESWNQIQQAIANQTI